MAEKKTIVVSFRLEEEEFEPYRILLEKSTMSRSAFFREIFIAHKKEITLKEKSSPDYKTLLFYVNKASNNINQMARLGNKANKSNLITEDTYIKMLNQLVSIANSLKGALHVGEG
ncbi:Uncharacterised protein [Yersinia aldovae]|uniref:plasmid mobilization protein n=1 Tax=Yersinia aldovae TaxID=29483 RepID=UPI0005DA6DBD|nr:hypothetical protein [Yersinia aldovae]CNK26201.1 Uncharacterised protein [Yersinia aldovae]